MKDFKENFNKGLEKGTSKGTGVVGLLGVAFVILKLIGEISWSWWWVLAPFWGPFALIIGIIIAGLAVTFVFYLFSILISLFTKERSQ